MILICMFIIACLHGTTCMQSRDNVVTEDLEDLEEAVEAVEVAEAVEAGVSLVRAAAAPTAVAALSAQCTAVGVAIAMGAVT